MLLNTVAALAADPIFPPGSGIGLAPPPGMVPAPNFSGFRDETTGGIILLTKFPGDAFSGVVAGVVDDAKLATAGIVVRTRENLTIGGNPAFLFTGTQVIRGVNFRYWAAIVGSPYGTALVNAQYPEATAARSYDEAIRAALTSVTLRPEPPLSDQIAALPFTLPNLGRFRVVTIITGLIVGLTDGPKDMDPDDTQTQLLVTASQRVPPDELRQTVARQGFLDHGRRMQVVGVDSESLITIGELPAYQTIGRVRNEKGIELKTVQWLVFGSNQTLLVDATSRPEQFDLVWPQLVAIRNGVHLK
jgi:hypothetical protein